MVVTYLFGQLETLSNVVVLTSSNEKTKHQILIIMLYCMNFDMNFAPDLEDDTVNSTLMSPHSVTFLNIIINYIQTKKKTKIPQPKYLLSSISLHAYIQLYN